MDDFTSDEIIKDSKSDSLTLKALKYENSARGEVVKSLQLKNKQLEQNISERRKYAKKFYKLNKIWMWIICGILALQGLRLDFLFSLSEEVIITLLGTTTATIIGLLVIVARYLFPEKED